MVWDIVKNGIAPLLEYLANDDNGYGMLETVRAVSHPAEEPVDTSVFSFRY